MTTEDDRVKAALALFAAIERGDRAALLDLYAENAVQVEHPNRLKTNGDRRGPARMAEDLARGKTMLRSERYEVLGDGDGRPRGAADQMDRSLYIAFGALERR